MLSRVGPTSEGGRFADESEYEGQSSIHPCIMAQLGARYRKVAGEAGNSRARGLRHGRWHAPKPRLPVKLRADLTDARIARIADDSEVRIGDVPARILKLCVVEDVEKFETDIESVILLNYGPLQYAKIGVVESRAVEEASIGGAKSAQIGVDGECVGQEVTSRTVRTGATGVRLARIHSHNLADEIRHIRGRAPGQ